MWKSDQLFFTLFLFLHILLFKAIYFMHLYCVIYGQVQNVLKSCLSLHFPTECFCCKMVKIVQTNPTWINRFNMYHFKTFFCLQHSQIDQANWSNLTEHVSFWRVFWTWPLDQLYFNFSTVSIEERLLSYITCHPFYIELIFPYLDYFTRFSMKKILTVNFCTISCCCCFKGGKKVFYLLCFFVGGEWQPELSKYHVKAWANIPPPCCLFVGFLVDVSSLSLSLSLSL
jgi:hypothetical protein